MTDTTGGVLPGVTITAIHVESGNTYTAVTDERGTYRIPLRTGVYKITAELSGFATLTRTGLELLVGQQAVVNLQMQPSTVQESVTVTAEAPLVNTTNSSIGGNVDTRQLSELPVNGRNWVDLTMLAPGSPRQLGLRNADGPEREQFGRLSAQRRRPAGDAGSGVGLRPAPLEQRCHRGVPVHREPVRRHAGALERHAGERHHQVGHQHVCGIDLRLLPERQVQCRRFHRQSRASLLGPAGERDLRRPDQEGPGPFLRQLRIRAPAADLHL